MIFQNRKRFIFTVTLIGLMGFVTRAVATPNIAGPGSGNRQMKSALKTTASCQPATAALDLDINNVDARYMTGGDMWWNIGTQVAAYEVPKGSGKSSQFAASCWIGGFDEQGQLKVAAQTYRQDGNDYWPGALDAQGNISASQCSDWDKFWKVNASDIAAFQEMYKSGGSNAVLNNTQFANIVQWPAKGNVLAKGTSGGSLNLSTGHDYAPFVDLNNNGTYEPSEGEYPKITGDQYMWWVFNDEGNVKEQSQTAAIGLEVQTDAFAYSSQDFLNDATFCEYKVINRGNLTIDSTYIAVWDDADLGYAFDDYIGCDTTRGLGIEYNGAAVDGSGQVNSYGTDVPMVGVDFFQGPTRIVDSAGVKDTVQLSMTNFTYYNNDFSTIGNPTNGIGIYNYMTGSILDGSRFSDDFTGAGTQSHGYGKGPTTHFVFFGDPGDNTQWSECSCGNQPNDRRFIESAGPFQLVPGAVNDIIFGVVWVPGVGGCPNTNFRSIESVDDQAQTLFDEGFKKVEGPNAPTMTYRELDRHVILYLNNPYGSNNYKEQYGRSDSAQYQQADVKASKLLNLPDSLYKFQGYRIFQLADGSVTPAQIEDATTGEVDNTKAREIFECDLRDSITTIINYVKNTTISDTTWIPQLKVTGHDSGIVHSFEVTQDAFATTDDKRLVNYKTYYFVAIAYAYNDFSFNKITHTGGFNPRRSDSTQDQPYLESAHGAGGIAIQVEAVMPNPANGDMGTVINSDYGSGIAITRLAGVGNGGQVLQLSDSSETAALNAPYIAQNATYAPGNGPVDVKVVDPVKVQPINWHLYLQGVQNTTSPDKGLNATGATWVLAGVDANGNNDTVYSETDIATLDEQLLADYGLSVSIQQQIRPGDNQSAGNGYITSDVTFSDPSHPWLTGVQDQSDSSVLNWIRSGNNDQVTSGGVPDPCNFNDNKVDTLQAYGSLLANNSLTKNTWAPYELVAPWTHVGQSNPAAGSPCGFALAPSGGYQSGNLFNLHSVDIVFTSDKKLWSRCVVLETQEDPSLAQGHAPKFSPRSHASVDSNIVTSSGAVSYSNIANDTGMSWFPGYAIDEETGMRLNIVFGEDSWLASDNGNDMLWNPTSTLLNAYDASIVFGGKHFVWVSGTKYDADSAFLAGINSPITTVKKQAWQTMQYAGIPMLNPIEKLLPLSQGLIPSTTRLRFRVTRPYAYFAPGDASHYPTVANLIAPYTPDAQYLDSMKNNGTPVPNNGLPFYTFNTKDLAPTPLSDVTDKGGLLKRIGVVPNPYYGYSGYESNRYDTRVRIINLPAKATVTIYSLDGSLIRTLTKSDPNASYLDWDIRNNSGLPIASGMYLMDVKADGIGETVLRWFGAMRPIDITTY